MSRHRAEPPRRRAAPPAGRRRAESVRPRYGRFAVLGASVSVTGIAMLGGVGVLPSVASNAGHDDTTAHDSAAGLAGAATTPSAQSTEESSQSDTSSGEAGGQSSAQPPGTPQKDAKNQPSAGTNDGAQDDMADEDTSNLNPSLPDDSGDGKRIVFDQSDQRVWLVDDDETVERTYLVSGSLYDNLDPGTYAVYSKSEQAWGIDDSGTMEYFVRFTEGDNGAAIGFHDIPIDRGQLVQTVDQLGTPQSHGCIRQERDDAIALWDFAPVGTEVDVTA
jgi:lipoprotein-anchoring transpeptidase ErfK/SrfK